MGLLSDLITTSAVAVESFPPEKEITMFYENEAEITPAEFRNKIGTMLPKYMIPTVYYHMDLLPRNTNGKIDRLALKTKVNEG